MTEPTFELRLNQLTSDAVVSDFEVGLEIGGARLLQLVEVLIRETELALPPAGASSLDVALDTNGAALVPVVTVNAPPEAHSTVEGVFYDDDGSCWAGLVEGLPLADLNWT